MSIKFLVAVLLWFPFSLGLLSNGFWSLSFGSAALAIVAKQITKAVALGRAKGAFSSLANPFSATFSKLTS